MNDLNQFTRDDLYELHSKFFHEGMRLHERFMALNSCLSAEALMLAAKHAEISESMDAVGAEIDRREQEISGA